MPGNATIVITGLAKAEADLGPERFARAIAQGFDEIGGLVEEYAVTRVAKHRWQGKLAGSFHKMTTGSGTISSEKTLVTTAAPQARSFRGGWFSKGGHQPPTSQIAEWLGAKGRDPRFAFVVARQIGARSKGAAAGVAHGITGTAFGRLGGYSFGKLRLFPTKSWIGPRATEAIRAAIKATQL